MDTNSSRAESPIRFHAGSHVDTLAVKFASGKVKITDALHFVRDLVWPSVCPGCQRPTTAQPGLCPGCWSQMRFIEYPYCERLGTPFSYDLGAGALSAEAIAEPPPFERLRAVACYNAMAGKLAADVKFRDRLDVAPMLAGWMARAGEELLRNADILVPVPLHRGRLWRRRFNQAAVLVRHLTELSGRPAQLDAIDRVRATRQQVGLTAREREVNVRGAFRVRPGQVQHVAGRAVLLVDDVYTTGATIRAATRALTRAGAARVDILVFARVVGGEENTI